MLKKKNKNKIKYHTTTTIHTPSHQNNKRERERGRRERERENWVWKKKTFFSLNRKLISSSNCLFLFPRRRTLTTSSSPFSTPPKSLSVSLFGYSSSIFFFLWCTEREEKRRPFFWGSEKEAKEKRRKEKKGKNLGESKKEKRSEFQVGTFSLYFEWRVWKKKLLILFEWRVDSTECLISKQVSNIYFQFSIFKIKKPFFFLWNNFLIYFNCGEGLLKLFIYFFLKFIIYFFFEFYSLAQKGGIFFVEIK